MHTPVMSGEVLDYLAVRPESIVVDATAGLGGHTARIAARLSTGRVFSCDRDGESIELARAATMAWAERITFVRTKFSGLRAALAGLGVGKINGLLADLGVSRYQLTDPERGFSLSAEGPPDMRMDRTQELTAADFLNFYPERELADLIYQYGEERRARQIARAVVRARPIRSTLHLAQVVESVARRTGRTHPATKTFQALRMAVNSEPPELDALLESGPELLGRGGRFVVLTFMSLDDRKVKNCFRELARQNRAILLTKHVVTPSETEVASNPASRSAKLRALEMT
ncbi:MAG: 16S rRNA (cytosine(1402)-N(4))-methyltransferase RsmH [Bryobacterales bacterium]|nr:16S rRNA (cytosine(1402)-N(4))-methyltransferase RsmH [Bryobacterales bacterium]